MSLKNKLQWKVREFLVDHYPKMIIDHEWPAQFGHKIDWNNPRDINEKIQWLICFSDTSEWTRLADKYRVREFVKERGLEHILTHLYGVWDDASKIDFDVLPDKFVLKCNHDSGSTIIVDKSRGFEKEQLINNYNHRLKQKFGYTSCEPFYNKIDPLIIAEEFLEPPASSADSIVDYKIWAFNGHVESIWACYNRTEEATYVNIFDHDWQCHPEYSVFTEHYRDGKGRAPRPEHLDEMIQAASILSKGFPQVRADFYEVKGKLYFSEMTFTSLYGRMDFYTQEYLEKLGSMVVLPKKRCPIKF